MKASAKKIAKTSYLVAMMTAFIVAASSADGLMDSGRYILLGIGLFAPIVAIWVGGKVFGGYDDILREDNE